MNCPRSNLISAYHDGELSLPAARELEAHLRECPLCRAELEQARLLSGRVRSARLAEPPADVVERWVSDFSAMRDRGVRRLASWMTAAAATVMVAVGLFTLLDQRMATPILLGPAETVALVPEGEAAPQTIVAAEWMATDLAGGVVADVRRRP